MIKIIFKYKERKALLSKPKGEIALAFLYIFYLFTPPSA